jgi:hypothetical protein
VTQWCKLGFFLMLASPVVYGDTQIPNPVNNGAMTLSITALSIMTLSLKDLNVTLSISDAHHK